MFDSVNRAVAGETFSGAEGTYTWLTIGANDGEGSVDDVIWLDSHSYKLQNYNLHDLYIKRPSAQSYEFAAKILYRLDNSSIKLDRRISRTNGDYIITASSITSARPQFLMCDIIGSLEAMPPEFLEHGLPGNWLATDEDGNSLIPDGTQKNYKLSRKCLECYQVLSTNDKGVTWTDATHSDKANAEGAGNTLGNYSTTADFVKMVFYRTSANPFELADRSHMKCIGVCEASNSNNLYQSRALFGSNLIGKVVTSSDADTETFDLSKYSLMKEASPRFYLDDTFAPEHLPIIRLSTEAPTAFKVLSSLGHVRIGSSITYTLQTTYKELKHNGTQWGDDNKFNIVDKQSTVTDLNGEFVIVGQKRVELPYQFDGVTY